MPTKKFKGIVGIDIGTDTTKITLYRHEKDTDKEEEKLHNIGETFIPDKSLRRFYLEYKFNKLTQKNTELSEEEQKNIDENNKIQLDKINKIKQVKDSIPTALSFKKDSNSAQCSKKVLVLSGTNALKEITEESHNTIIEIPRLGIGRKGLKERVIQNQSGSWPFTLQENKPGQYYLLKMKNQEFPNFVKQNTCCHITDEDFPKENVHEVKEYGCQEYEIEGDDEFNIVSEEEEESKDSLFCDFLNADLSFFNPKGLLGVKQRKKPSSEKLNTHKIQMDYITRLREILQARDIEEIGVKLDFNSYTNMTTPMECFALYLSHLAEIIQLEIEEEISDIILTIPNNSTSRQKLMYESATKLAHLNLVGMVPTTTAAALSFKKQNPDLKDENILFFELGSGTINASVISCGKDLKVLSSIGYDQFGSKEFDMEFTKYLVKIIRSKVSHIDINQSILYRLRKHCKSIKEMFNNMDQVTNLGTKEIEIQFRKPIKKKKSKTEFELQTPASAINGLKVYTIDDIPTFVENDLPSIRITRDQYDRICFDLYCKCVDVIKYALMDANILKIDIDLMVMLGGGSKLKTLEKFIRMMFNQETFNSTKNNINVVIETDIHAMSKGACYYGEYLDYVKKKKTPPLFENVINMNSYPIGFEKSNGMKKIVIDKNMPLTISKTENVKKSIVNKNDTAEIAIFEGYSSFTKDCEELYHLVVRGEGTALLKLTYQVDINGKFSLIYKVNDKEKFQIIDQIDNYRKNLTSLIDERMMTYFTSEYKNMVKEINQDTEISSSSSG